MKKIRVFFKAILKSRAFVISMFMLLAVIFLWPFIAIMLRNLYYYFHALYLFDWQIVLRLFWVLLELAVIAFLSIVYLIPALLFVIRRIVSYVSILFFCLRHRYKYKLPRVPFFSLGGVKNKGDIEIAKNDKIYCLHFIDIPFRFRRVLTVIDGNKYVITRAVAGKIERRGGYPGGRIRGNVGAGQITGLFCNIDYALVKGTDKFKDLPDFKGDTKHEHILMMDVIPVDALIRKNSSFEILSSGEKLDSMTFYYKKGFLKMLNR